MEFLQPPQRQQLAWQGRQVDILDGQPLDDVDSHGVPARGRGWVWGMVGVEQGALAGTAEKEQEEGRRGLGKSHGLDELGKWEGRIRAH